MTLQDKILELLNEHYKEEGQTYDSFILYAFQETNDELAMRAMFHKIGVLKMVGAKENIDKELDDGMKEALDNFKYSQMH